MQNSSALQYLAIDTIHESATNPRRAPCSTSSSRTGSRSKPLIAISSGRRPVRTGWSEANQAAFGR